MRIKIKLDSDSHMENDVAYVFSWEDAIKLAGVAALKEDDHA